MRLFIAVPFSPEVNSALTRGIDSIRAQANRCRPTAPENLHLTLAFIGESDRWRDAARAVSGLARPAFRIFVGGTGRFGELWWAGIARSRELEALARDTRLALDSSGLAYDRKPFKPHITLARQVEARDAVTIEIPRLEMTASRVCLMKSERISGRLVYSELYGLELGAL